MIKEDGLELHTFASAKNWGSGLEYVSQPHPADLKGDNEYSGAGQFYRKSNAEAEKHGMQNVS
jgi:hypothetical protein